MRFVSSLSTAYKNKEILCVWRAVGRGYIASKANATSKIGLLFALLVLQGQVSSVMAASKKTSLVQFDIPRQSASDSLPMFGQQANVTLVYPFDDTKKHTTNRLYGWYTLKEGIHILLQDTGLHARFSADGHLIISKKKVYGENTMKTKKNLLAGLIGLFASGAIAEGKSEKIAQGSEWQLEEIVVTARKIEESIQDTPISVVAFGSNELEKIGVFEPEDISSFSPNVQVLNQPGSQDNYSYTIRGVRSDDSALAIDPTVGFYLDGVYIARAAGAAFDITDIERIEVLRGPQGTLYGRNTIGGVINVITEKPLGEFAAKQLFSVGNNDYYRVQTTVDTPTFGDFALKLSYMYNERDGFANSIYTGGEVGQAQAEAFRFAANWTPSSVVSVDYSYDWSERENNASTHQIGFVRPFQTGLGGTLYAQATATADSDNRRDRLFTTRDQDDDIRSTINSHAATIRWDITEDMMFKSISGYRERKSKAGGTQFGLFVSDGVTVLDGDGGFLPAGDLVSFFESFEFQTNTRQFTQEFQLIGTAFDDKFHYNTGIFYLEESGSLDQPVGGRLVLPASFAYASLDVSTSAFLCGDELGVGNIDIDGDGFADFATACLGKDAVIQNPPAFNSIDNESIAIYGAFTYAVSRQLDVTLGVRYTEDEKGASLLFGGSDLSVQEESYSNFSPSITFDYLINDDVSTYFKVTNGYRAGGFNVRASTQEAFSVPIDEETILSYELGLKSDFFDNTLRLNAALFHFKYDDQQVTQFVAGISGSASIIVNAGKSETSGFEMDATWLPIKGLRISANYGYLDTDFKEFDTPFVDPVTGITDTAGGNVDISDIAFRGSPSTQEGALIVEYEFAPKNYGQLSLRVESTWVDERSFNPQLNLYDTADPYSLLNARATLADIPAGRDGYLSIAVWGKNLLDKEYANFGVDFGSLGFTTTNFGDPLTYGLDITYTFNR